MKKIIFFVSILVLVGIISSCGGKKATADSNLVAEGPYETLIPANEQGPAYVLIERPTVKIEDFPKDEEGYYVIFDGSSFNGWRGYNKDGIPPRWSIDDGALKFSGSGIGEAQEADGGDIIFTAKLKNFELAFDWKVAKASNSGVFYLAQEIKGQPIWYSSPEYQILDNENHTDASQGVDGNRQSASLYDMIPAKPQNALPYGEWNTGAITVFKGSVFHKQNGKTVLEYHAWTPKWNEMITNSKFSPKGEYPLAYRLLINLGGEKREGYIGFQDHSDDVWFKNIRIKILD